MKSIQRKVIWVVVILLLFTLGALSWHPTQAAPGEGATVFLPLVINEISPASGTVGLMPNVTIFSDNAGYVYIQGEVANNTDSNLVDVVITMEFLDNNRNPIDPIFYKYQTVPYLDSLPAHERTCFEFFMAEPENWYYLRFEPPTYKVGGYPLPALTLLNPSGIYDFDTGAFDITGRVWNNTAREVNLVSTVGTLYNAARQVIGCSEDYLDVLDLAPAQSSAFNLNYSWRDYTDADSYRIQVDGLVQ